MQSKTQPNRLSSHLIPLALLAAGCATQPNANSAAPSTPVNASETPSNPAFPRQRELVTSLSVRDAADRVFSGLSNRLGLSHGSNVDVSFGSPDSTLHAFPKTSDYFSAIGDLSTASGDVIHIDCEWIAEGKTRVILQSDLPEDRFTMVEQVAADSLTGTLLH
jgi:hypothetical protein